MQAESQDISVTVNETVHLITSKLEAWTEAGIAKLPNLAVAVIVAVLFWIAARLVKSAVSRGLSRTHLHEPVRNIIAGAIGFAVVVTGFFIALGILGLDKTVTSLLAGVGIIGLALGFAFQDLASNFIAGLFLSFRRPFEVGHIVETNGFLGTIREINLRDTVMRRFTGQIVRIPNKEVFNNPIVNYSETGERRVDLNVGVSYGDDLAKVKDLTLETVRGLTCCHNDKPVDFYYEAFGDSSINFVVRFWLDFEKQPDFLAARSEAIMAIKKRFDENDITIPFPIRTLDFGISGGESLTDSMKPLLRTMPGGPRRGES